jgi:hypothetical protein
MGATPEPTPSGLRSLNNLSIKLARLLGINKHDPMELEKWVNIYTGVKLRKAQEGAEILVTEGLNKYSGYVSNFIKFEMLAKATKDPRMISFRSKEYNAALGHMIKNFEHHVYCFCNNNETKYFPTGRLCAKGLNARKRAMFIKQKAKQFANPMFVLTDAKRFDQHISKQLLTIEHSIYRQCLRLSPDQYKLLDEVLASQLYNKMSFNVNMTRYIKASTVGRRMSGDMTTGLGNILLMLTMVAAWINNRIRWQCLNDGDDNLLIIDAEDIWIMDDFEESFLTYGQEMSIDAITKIFEEIEFCQAHPVVCSIYGGYRMIRKPAKVISNSLTAHKYSSTPSLTLRYYATVGLGEYIINRGIPILQSFGRMLMRWGEGYETLCLNASDPLAYRFQIELGSYNPDAWRKYPPVEPTALCRISFYKAYGVTPCDQVALEDHFNTLPYPTTTTIYAPDESRPTGLVLSEIQEILDSYSIFL